MNANELASFLQCAKEVDEYDNVDCRILAADSIRQLVDFVRQQQAEIEALKTELSFFQKEKYTEELKLATRYFDKAQEK